MTMRKILDFLAYYLLFVPAHYTPAHYYEFQQGYARLGRPDLMSKPYWLDTLLSRIPFAKS